jgi:hypothetical protein
MGFEKIPAPGNPEEKEEVIRFEEGGRNFSMTPEEKEAHEKAEAKRKLLEKTGAIEAVESEGGNLNLTGEEQKILESMVPDAATRNRLGPEAARMLVDMKKEELGKEKREAA